MNMKHAISIAVRLKPREEIVIHMPYTGKQLINTHLCVKEDTLQWMKELSSIVGIITRSTQLVLKPLVLVFVYGIFKYEKTTPDLQVFQKVICDALSEGLGIETKYFVFTTGSSQTQKYTPPQLIISISQRIDEK
ncbi:hypothetical protein LCGC14_0627990 [marine sediment metagenome]|uniref:Uncharacterized protein n=1 Tax=marine sediment metagenome TaxID=412755 RepID=A0A0F9R804_9ZZZZ